MSSVEDTRTRHPKGKDNGIFLNKSPVNIQVSQLCYKINNRMILYTIFYAICLCKKFHKLVFPLNKIIFTMYLICILMCCCWDSMLKKEWS